MKVFNNNSIYQLLVFLLLTNKKERKVFIVGNSFPPEIKKRLNYQVIEINNLSIKINSKTKLTFAISFIINLIKLRIEYNKKIKNRIKNYDIYGSTILSKLLNEKNRIFILEDGTGNYRERIKCTKKQKVISFVTNIFIKCKHYYQNEAASYIINIFLTRNMNIPKYIKNKVVQIDLQTLWNNKTKSEKEEILSIFGIENFDKKIDKRNIILFTQPLSEDGFVETEKEKINIYKKALKNIDYDKVIIKTHPREKTNYKQYFKNVEQFNSVFPFQLLMLQGFKFKKAITLFSTTVLSLDENIEIIWYGTTLSHALQKRIGDFPIEKFLKNGK